MKQNFYYQFTDKGCKSLNAFLKEASKQPRLNANEQAMLVASYQRNPESKEGLESRDKLVLSNLLFVVKIAKMFIFRTDHPLEDLVSEGCIGLIKAADLYKPQEGATFLSYAVNWIYQSIQLFIDNNGLTIRLPQNQLVLMRNIEKAKRDFFQENYYEPDEYDLADLLNETVEHIKDTMMMMESRVDLDKPIYQDEDNSSSIGDTIPDGYFINDDELLAESRSIEIKEALKRTLTPRDQEVVKYNYGLFGYEPKTLTQISEKFEISDERARQIIKCAVRKLRKVEPLHDYRA